MRKSLILGAALAAIVGSASAQQDRELIERSANKNARPKWSTVAARNANWNPDHQVLFKGSIRAVQVSVPQADGRKYVHLLVKLVNGGTAMVELGPKEYVEAQGLDLRMKATIWIAGAKTYVNAGSMVVAQRVNYDGARPAFRLPDGSPLWR